MFLNWIFKSKCTTLGFPIAELGIWTGLSAKPSVTCVTHSRIARGSVQKRALLVLTGPPTNALIQL